MLADVGENLCGLPALLHGGYAWSDVVHAQGTQKAAANACLEAGVSVTRLVEAGAPVDLLTGPALALAEANRGYRSMPTGEGAGPSARLLDRIRELLACGASVPSLVHGGAPPHLLLKVRHATWIEMRGSTWGIQGGCAVHTWTPFDMVCLSLGS